MNTKPTADDATALQPGFKIQTSFFANGDITQETTDLAGQICRKVIRTEDQQIRKALTGLGWLTPESGEVLKRIAMVAHGGGLAGYPDAHEAMNEIRRLSQPWLGDQVDMAQKQTQ
jgi:hypothetical protein